MCIYLTICAALKVGEPARPIPTALEQSSMWVSSCLLGYNEGKRTIACSSINIYTIHYIETLLWTWLITK